MALVEEVAYGSESQACCGAKERFPSGGRCRTLEACGCDAIANVGAILDCGKGGVGDSTRENFGEGGAAAVTCGWRRSVDVEGGGSLSGGPRRSGAGIAANAHAEVIFGVRPRSFSEARS